MNERIKELRKQAWDYVVSCDEHLSKSATDLFEEKFVELIVRECAQKGFDVFDEEPDATCDAARYYVRDKIKEHFGVE